MREELIGVIIVLACYVIRLTSAAVLLKPFSLSFNDLPAKFAVAVNSSGICGGLHVFDPPDACSSLQNGSFSDKSEQIRFALIVRGQCAFEDKVQNAQNGGFRAAIVYDDRDKGNLVYMMLNPEGVSVHAVFVSKATGEYLKEHTRGEEGECCIFPNRQETAWTVLAISLISLLIVLAIIAPFFTLRHWWYWRQRTNSQSKSVDIKMVEAIPRITFNSACFGDSHMGETCAICLEDYKDGELLKVLPCHHEFHSKCVGSWLTKWGTSCPVCKHDMRTKT